jgi:rhodanese-related sulfurtransferase
VYCSHGIRSLRGCRILRERHGFRSTLSLRGGITAWSA